MLDLYIIMPLRHTSVHEASLDIYPTVDWTIGVAGLSMAYGIIHVLPQNTPYRRQVVQFNWANFDHLDVAIITREVILPSIKYLCVIICLPSLVTVIVTWLLGECLDLSCHISQLTLDY